MTDRIWCFSKTFRFFSCRSFAAFSIMSCKKCLLLLSVVTNIHLITTSLQPHHYLMDRYQVLKVKDTASPTFSYFRSKSVNSEYMEFKTQSSLEQGRHKHHYVSRSILRECKTIGSFSIVCKWHQTQTCLSHRHQTQTWQQCHVKGAAAADSNRCETTPSFYKLP